MIKMKDLTLEEAQLLWDLGTKEDLRFKYVRKDGRSEDEDLTTPVWYNLAWQRPLSSVDVLPGWIRVYMLKVEDEEDNA